MFNSTTIDVAIGLVFVFLLLSLIASAAKELFEALIKRRANDLERGIRELLGGDSDKFVAQLYNHGLINSLYKGKYDTTKKGELPSYIPSKNFALALMDLRNQIEANPPTITATLPSNVKQAFDAFTISAGQDVAKLQQLVEDWFNSSMDRVSGWYKRRSQWWVFGLGLFISIVINADCIVIAKRLSTDVSLRQAAVKAAEQEVQDNKSKAKATDQQSASTSTNTKGTMETIKSDLSKLDGIGLPLGWDELNPARTKDGWDRGKLMALFGHGLFHHFPGWLLTAIAVSLGAPFWFDMLNKIMVIRSTVKPHEKSKEEGSKDPGGTKQTPPAAGAQNQAAAGHTP